MLSKSQNVDNVVKFKPTKSSYVLICGIKDGHHGGEPPCALISQYVQLNLL